MSTDAAQAKSIFLAASDILEPARRESYLNDVCGENVGLRARVEALLAAHEAAPLGTNALDDATRTEAGALRAGVDVVGVPVEVGTVLDRKYKLLEVIGEGGMGAVYSADQLEPVRRRVAVKVVRADLDSKAVLARFDAERQALAVMDHPNIARVLDAGATDRGRPYFVMDLVKGVPITRYCDDHQLDLRQRLELFIPVCYAIQHAHQKGVIHRDIKPSNVLVALYDGRPAPKVIDFGVAKAAQTGGADARFASLTNSVDGDGADAAPVALTTRTLFTGFGALVGTPEYMSPEQASLNNLDVDTRSDVYSLGVLLYELLTGTTPIDRATLGRAALLEVLRVVREVDAPKPSERLSTAEALPSVAANRATPPAKLARLFKGDLDWVLLKALEKDRKRRYETADALARDIERHLADEAVEARRPSVWYRARKFVRRHRGAVATANLIVLVVLAFVASLFVQTQRARAAERVAIAAQASEAERAEGERRAKAKADDEARQARRQAEVADAVRMFLEHDIIAQANPLAHAASSASPDPDLTLKAALDRAAPRVAGRFAGKPLIEASIRRALAAAYAGRGLFKEALAEQEKACDLFAAALAGKDESDLEALGRGPYVEALLELVTFRNVAGQSAQALAAVDRAEAEVKRLFHDDPEGMTTLETIAGLRAVMSGKGASEALAKNRAVLKEIFEAPGSPPHHEPGKSSAGGGASNAASPFKLMEDLSAAMKLMTAGRNADAEQALAKMVELTPEKAEAATLLPLLAEARRLQGKSSAALADFEKARNDLRKTFGEDHPSIASCDYGIALTSLAEKKFDLAEASLQRALAYYQRRAPDDLIRFELKSLLGAALMGQKRFSAAEPLLLEGFHGLKAQTNSASAPRSSRMSEALERLIDFYVATNKPEEAKKWQAERATSPGSVPVPK